MDDILENLESRADKGSYAIDQQWLAKPETVPTQLEEEKYAPTN